MSKELQNNFKFIPSGKFFELPDKCPNCGMYTPTDSWRDYISEDEINFCYHCGIRLPRREDA